MAALLVGPGSNCSGVDSAEECAAARHELALAFEPYGDLCVAPSDCRSGICSDGVCSCLTVEDCRSGLCVAGLCANPLHDPQLTPGLPTVERPVRPLCGATSATSGDRAAACGRVRALLADDSCPDACRAVALRICACRAGGARFSCLDTLALTLATERGDPALGPEAEACAGLLEEFSCARVTEPVDGPCGRPLECACPGTDCATAGVCLSPEQCRSGVCADGDESDNNTAAGDNPLDWHCVSLCTADVDCPVGHRCDRYRPSGDGRYLCQRLPTRTAQTPFAPIPYPTPARDPTGNPDGASMAGETDVH